MRRPKCGKENLDARVHRSWSSASPRAAARGSTVISVVIVVLVLLAMLGTILPALFSRRQHALIMACGKNLSDIGRAMKLYSNDYDGEFPRSGGTNSRWAKQIPNWMAPNRFIAYYGYGLAAEGTRGVGNISSCFYLLVKYGHLTPDSFVCKGDKGTTVFDPVDDGVADRELADLWDFGSSPGKH
ncbi:MAG: hypothetical protein ACYTGS_16110, partial [Planctomycetota bacterium]